MSNLIRPLKQSTTVSVASGGSGIVTISVPSADRWQWRIKSLTITKGADITVDSIKIDGIDLQETTSISDTVAKYGDTISVLDKIEVNGSNSALSAEDLTVEIVGIDER
jgi:hypothetical protein